MKSTETSSRKLKYTVAGKVVTKTVYAKTFGEAVLKLRKAGVTGTVEAN